LDAKGAGRFFYGSGAGSSLELHGVILKNGNAFPVRLVDSVQMRYFLASENFSSKRTNSNFRSNSRGGTCNSVFRSAVVAPNLTKYAGLIQIALAANVRAEG
jgi:hypothetical protein